MKKLYISCKDYLVSRETFDLFLDENLDLLITEPVPKDLSKYYQSERYISHTDSKRRIVDILYQMVKQYRLRQKLKLVNSFTKNILQWNDTAFKNQKVNDKTTKKLLDMGCGTGDFLKICHQNNWNVTGIEPNKNAREKLFKKIKHPLKIYKDIEDLIQNIDKDTRYNAITLWHVLEHMPGLDETIFQLKQLLHPEGTLFIAVPNFKSYDADYYKTFWAAYDVPRHLWHFSQTAVQRLFFFQNMKVIKTLPMKFDAYYISLLSEKNKRGKNHFLRAFYKGFISNLKAKKTREYSALTYVIKHKKNWF